MKILDVRQGSTEWLTARLGVVTASEVDALVTPLWKPRTGAGVETYLYRKLAEKLVGYMPEFGGTYAMDQGGMAEKIALPWFNFTFDADARQVGFCVSDDGKIGASPDALIGDNDGLELKYPTPPLHLKYLAGGVCPPEYLAQCHFAMLVTARPKWTFCSFSTVFEPLVVRLKRDEHVQSVLRSVVDDFYARFEPQYAKLKAAIDAQNASKDAAFEASITKEMLVKQARGESTGEDWLREMEERRRAAIR